MIHTKLFKIDTTLIMKKAALLTLLASLSLPVIAQYKITFGVSSLNLPDPAPEQSPTELALNFEGDDYVVCGNLGLVSYPFTMEGKFKADFVENQTVFMISNFSSLNDLTAVQPQDDGSIRVSVANNEVFDSFSSSGEVYTKNKWHHVAIVFVSDTEKYLYLDGNRLVKDTANRPLGIGFDMFNIGGFSRTFPDTNESGHRGSFRGSLSNVRVWNIARTETEIQNNIDQELKGTEPGLIAYYPFIEGSGTTLVDATDNGNDGTINGATWVEK